MPAQHNHNDRGVLHEGCAACAVVAELMTDAGVPPGQVFDYHDAPEGAPGTYTPRVSAGSTQTFVYPTTVHHPTQHLHTQHVHTTDFTHDIHGEEMGNKAKVSQERADATHDVMDHYGFNQRLVAMWARGNNTSTISMLSHLNSEHSSPEWTDLAIRLNDLTSVQTLHSLLHSLSIGHYDSLGAEHMVSPADMDKINSRARHEQQKHWSTLSKGLKAEQHRRREQRARESRDQVLVESARALKRAIEHAKGTVLPRVLFDTSGDYQVDIKVGIKDRVTIAAASIGTDVALGTAICHPTDKFDPEVGSQLAVARALIALGTVHELEWMINVAEHNQ